VGASSDEEKAQLNIDESILTDVHVQGGASFGENDYLRLEIEGSPEPIILKPTAETIFGRRDPATGAMPDVDLTPFAGYRMGVSRRHAAIRFGDGQSLNLWDLGSSNGTYLNSERLSAHRPYRLHNGDELRLGQMMIRLHFQSSPPRPVLTPEIIEKPPQTQKLDEAEAKVEPAAAQPAPTEPPSELQAMPAKEAVTQPATEPPADKPAEIPAEIIEAPTTKPVDEQQRAELDATLDQKPAVPSPEPPEPDKPSPPQPEPPETNEKRD
jgi:predicted component of type VI protein secretion system